MPNPQQPELAEIGNDGPRGPVPTENQPGHHPAEEQDQPPLDKFAAKLGTMEPEERKDVLADEPPSVVNPFPAEAARRRTAVAGVAALVALILAVVAGRRIRSRR